MSLTEQPLDVDDAARWVADPSCGGIGLFAGVVRDHHEGEAVTGLTYEAWAEEAEPALRRVAEDVAAAHPAVRALTARHRIGALEIGEVSVVVAASAPHRAQALAATQALIDRVKAEVPIWKREHLAAGRDRWPGLDTDSA